MSAVQEAPEPFWRGRPRRSFEDSAAESELKFWGYHKGKQHAADGFPPSSTLDQLLSGRSDNPGHRVLVVDMPPKAWQINGRVMVMPTDYIAVLVARYCLPVERETGRPYEVWYLADLLGLSVDVYRRRLTQARKAYRRLMFTVDAHPDP